EALIGERLPPSAYRHRPWWANEVRGHSHAKAWLDANYHTAEVDMSAKKLTFVSVGGAQRAASRAASSNLSGSKGTGRHPLIGALKGLLTVEVGHDLASPASPELADELDSKYGPEKPQ